MVKKTNSNYCIKAILFYLVISFLPITLYAFDTIKNMPSRNAYFVGRLSYLDSMQKILSQHGKVYLTGYGGVGKSQLAKEFNYIHEQEYDLIWWFDAKGDIEIQYENLLTHLSNNEKFKKLLHVNINNIAPSVLVDFTNSLLSQCSCRWLLIFDNVIDNQNIKLPKIKASSQHIIITTREKQIFGNNVLAVAPFTNQESEQFLFKIHLTEKKEEIVKLYKTLHNYPLALAQISEEILMHQDCIREYFKKRIKLSTKLTPMRSDITQEYNNSYQEVLSLTLQDIERKDEEAAKVLYMLALLSSDITKKLSKDLFGDKIEDELIALGKYGIVQTTGYGNSQLLSIHDIIREEAIKRFNNKDTAHKKEIILTLSKYFNSFYSEKNFSHLNGLDATNNQAAPLYAFIDVALQNDIIDEGVINAVIVALKLNIDLFSRYANYVLYQQLANKIYHKNINNITPVKKALLYASLIASDFIYESEESLLKFEQELINSLKLIESCRNYDEEFFYIYTCISRFYLFLGNLNETKIYIEKAKKYINYVSNIPSLMLYWYDNMRFYYDLRDIEAGIKIFNNYQKINNEVPFSVSGKFFLKILGIRFKILHGQKDEAKKELEETIKVAAIYYNDVPSTSMGGLEFCNALIYFQNGQYDLALIHSTRAFNTLNKALGGDMLSSTQAHICLMLGKIYEGKKIPIFAIKKYKKALTYYNKKFYGRVVNPYEYGELLSNLCVIYYKQRNYAESKFYFQKLVANFGLEHEIVEKLIKKLPIEYIYQIDGGEK